MAIKDIHFLCKYLLAAFNTTIIYFRSTPKWSKDTKWVRVVHRNGGREREKISVRNRESEKSAVVLHAPRYSDNYWDASWYMQCICALKLNVVIVLQARCNEGTKNGNRCGNTASTSSNQIGTTTNQVMARLSSLFMNARFCTLHYPNYNSNPCFSLVLLCWLPKNRTSNLTW